MHLRRQNHNKLPASPVVLRPQRLVKVDLKVQLLRPGLSGFADLLDLASTTRRQAGVVDFLVVQWICRSDMFEIESRSRLYVL